MSVSFSHPTLLAVAACLASCATGERHGSVGIVDALGRQVSLESAARRIVSLSPATTELLFDLGAGDRLVGRTRWCDYPPAVSAIPSVGDGLNPNVEAVAATRPDLVVMYATRANDRAVALLSGLGIPAANVPMDALTDVSESARMLGRLLGDSARGDSVAAAFDAGLRALRGEGAGSGPSTVILAWDNPPIVIGAASFLNELVELAGGRNLFADISQPSSNVSIEVIAARNPDFILLQTNDSAVVPAWAGRPEWQVVPAVRRKRFVFLHGSEFGRPSLRALQAVAWLRREFSRAGM